MHGVQGHSGRSRGDHSASKSGRSLCSSPAVCHGSATRGGRPKRRRQQWHPFLVRIYLRCLKPCDPSGPNGCLITLLGCLLSSGWEILVGLSRMGFSCSSSGLALPRIRFRASAYSASRCAKDLTGKAGLLVELGLLTTPLLVGLLRMRICGGGPVGRLSS